MLVYGKSNYTKKKNLSKGLTKQQKEEYDDWCKKVGIGETQMKTVFKNVGMPSYKPPPGRETKRYPSLNDGIDTTFPTKKENPIYTGDNILGIGTLHKSNAVPVFSQGDAKDISNMRR